MAKEKGHAGFVIGTIALLSICIPYMYYAVQINIYGTANAPEGFHFPQITEFYKTLIGAAVCQIVRIITRYCVYDWCYSNAKVQDNEATRKNYAEKASKKAF
jgi:tetrahydromethanopterin S-methyltransferase subunit D